MKKIAFLAAVLAAIPALVMTAPVQADSPGQLANGANLYKVRNVTQNTGYSTSTNLACNEVAKYSIEVSNTQFGALSDVTVKANLANGNLGVTAVNTANETVTSNGNVQVSVANGGTLNYVAGSTERVSLDGNTRNTEGNGIVTAAGENVGNLAGSTRIFVQFQAKVKCEEPKNIQVCELATKNIITIREDQFDAAKHSKDLNKCAPVEPGKIKVCVTATKQIVTIKENEFDASKHTKDLNACNVTPVTPVTPEAPQVLAATGPVETFAQIVGVTALAGAISYYIASRRQNTLG